MEHDRLDVFDTTSEQHTIWVDEVYMCDADLMNKMLFNSKLKIVFVGDSKQNINRESKEWHYNLFKMLEVSYLEKNYRNTLVYDEAKTIDECVKIAKENGLYVSVEQMNRKYLK